MLLVWAIVSVTSQLWMHGFYYGPLEWLWRSLTYLELERFRRPQPAEAIA